MADVKAIAETLVNLTVKEVQELATVLKDEYGIEPATAAVSRPHVATAEDAASGMHTVRSCSRLLRGGVVLGIG